MTGHPHRPISWQPGALCALGGTRGKVALSHTLLLALRHQKTFRWGEESGTGHCLGEAQQVVEVAALPLYMLASMALKCCWVRQQEMK